MKLAYPEFLFAFLVLLIPIIIHLFNFRRYKTLFFSSLQFIRKVDQQTRSTQKLKHILILLLRVLAFSALVLAFCQPYIPQSQNDTNKGNPVLAIHVDNSFSMSAVGVNGELLSESREAARKIIENSSPETSFILTTNELDGEQQRIVDRANALDRIDEIQFSGVVKQLGTALNAQKEVMDRESRDGARQYVILSDFQKATGDISMLETDTTSFYYPIQLLSQNNNNLLIDSLWFTSPLRKANSNNELNVRVRNTGDDDYNNIQINLTVNELSRNLLIDVKANSTATTVINYTDRSEGWKDGKIELNDQQLFFDDAFYFSYNVQAENELLIINGEDAVNNIELVYSTDEYYKTTVSEANQLTKDDLSRKNLIVLNGLNSVSSGQREMLVNFANQGGTLLIFPGTKINTSQYNGFLSDLKMPSLGSPLTSGQKLKDLNYDDKFYEGILTEKPKTLYLPLFNKSYKVIQNTSFQGINLATFQNGNPFLVRSTTQNKIYLFSSALKEEFSQFTKHALFPSVLLRTAELSQRNNNLFYMIGTPAKIKIAKQIGKDEPIHLKKDEIDFIPRKEIEGQFEYLIVNDASSAENLEAGIYDITRQDLVAKVGINYNRLESDMKMYSAEEFKLSLLSKGAKNVSTNVVSDLSQIERLDLDKPHEYWRILLILAAVFFLTEMLLLKLWKV